MAHYALLDENNIVTEIIVGVDEDELIDGIDPEIWYGNFRGQKCVRTSYNTLANQHRNGKTPFRGNYAKIGGSYDPINDIFIDKKEKEYFVFNEEKLIWEYPTPQPGPLHVWNEESMEWVYPTDLFKISENQEPTYGGDLETPEVPK
jgi:hypothetical protein